MNRIDTQFGYNGQEDRRENKHGRSHIHKRAYNEQNQVYRQQNNNLVIAESNQGCTDGLRDVFE